MCARKYKIKKKGKNKLIGINCRAMVEVGEEKVEESGGGGDIFVILC